VSIQLNVNVKTVVGTTETVKGTAPSVTDDDFIRGSNGADIISAGDGNDRVWAGAGTDFVDGGAGDDVLYGESGNDTLWGGRGNDRLDGGSDNDTLSGDEGNDWLWGGSGNDYVDGGADNDLIWGGAGTDILKGGSGNDILWGESGDDWLDGGEGVDWLNGGSGTDRLTGGAGRDYFQYWIDNSQKNLNLGALWGKDTITDFTSGGPNGDLLDLRTLFERFSDNDVENILGQIEFVGEVELPVFDDNLFGFETETLGGQSIKFEIAKVDFAGIKQTQIKITNTDNVDANGNPLDTGATITLENISDLKRSDFLRETMKVVHGGTDDDTFEAANFDFIATKGAKVYGFGGGDTIDMTAATKRVELFGGEGDDDLVGGSSHDWLQGDNGHDTINGGNGNDSLHGGNGDDDLSGGEGNDSLSGGAGNDSLDGGNGNDILFGGGGNDMLTGGAGNDTFLIGGTVRVDWDAGKAFFNVNTGVTTISDFTNGDKIKFADFIPNWSLQSADLRQQFVSTWFDDHAEVVGDDLVIAGDNNGATSGGDWSITVTGRDDIYTDLKDGTFNYSDYFLFV
jgi:Ca2+-binding RTX toxin-like protein